MGLEALVGSAGKNLSRKLINGDVLAGIFASEEHEGKVFFATQQGDLWYVEGEEAYQVDHDDKGSLIGLGLPEESSRFSQGFGYDTDSLLVDLDDISRRVAGRPYLGDETARFRDQLVGLASEEVPVRVGEELSRAIASYVPTMGSVAPMGRYTAERTLLKRMDDRGKKGRIWNRPLNDRDAFMIASVASRLRGDDQPEPVGEGHHGIARMLRSESDRDILKHAHDIISEYVVGREFFIEGSIRSFLQEHGLFNGEGSHEQMYDVKRSRDHWQFSLHGDREVVIDIKKGEPAYAYERTLRPEPRKGLRDLYVGLKRGVRKTWDGVLGRAAPYIMGGLLLANGFSYWLGKRAAPQAEPPAQEWVQEAPIASSEKASMEASEEATYVVRPGDCLWDIAKERAAEKGDAAVLSRTDSLARLNGKLTIGEYLSRRDRGQRVSAGENPNLIFPGDTLRMPSYHGVEHDAAVVHESASVLADSSQVTRSDASGTLAAPLGISAFAKSDGVSIDEAVVEDPATTKGQVALPQGLERSLYVPALTQEKAKKADDAVLPSGGARDYVGVVQDLVRLRNEGASLGELRERYNGFRSDEEVRGALRDYQGMVQSGVIRPDEEGLLGRYDRRVASDAFKHRLVHEYAHSDRSLRDLSSSLSREYGMRVSASTISKYARRELGVHGRREARASGSW